MYSTDGQRYWVSMNIGNASVNPTVSVTKVSDLDVELIEQFGESWVNFLQAARGRGVLTDVVTSPQYLEWP